MKENGNHQPNSLLTKTSLAQSMTRGHPLYSAHRSVYCNKDPRRASNLYFIPPHRNSNGAFKNSIQTVLQKYHQSRMEKLLYKMYTDTKYRVAHPHVTFSPSSGDSFTRFLGSLLPVWYQNYARDHGIFRSISDYGVTFSVPSLAVFNPKATINFFNLTKMKHTIYYGDHPSQHVDLFYPETEYRGMVFFVHGGAWGSGMPWMYRLCATPFLEEGLVVAIVGYRTYPDGSVRDQVDDLELAYQYLKMKFPHITAVASELEQHTNASYIGAVLVGHSSGAHIALLWIVEQIEKRIQNEAFQITKFFDHFIGLSGVYNISHHFDYEAGRGVEELSPLKPACGSTREHFLFYSPAVRLQKILSDSSFSKNISIYDFMPRILFVHGIDDTTVPFTSTADAGRILRSCGVGICDEYYVPECGHSDVVTQLMLGGYTQIAIKIWLHGRKLNHINLTLRSNL